MVRRSKGIKFKLNFESLAPYTWTDLHEFAYEGRSFNGFIEAINPIYNLHFVYFDPSKYSLLTETHFSSLEILSVKAQK